MRNIFLFVWRNYFFFLFLLIEVFCFALVIQNNDYHRTSFINKTNDFFGSLMLKRNNIETYFSLAEKNTYLAQENAMLKEQMQSSFHITDKNYFYSNDSLYIKKFKYFEAKVINNSVTKRKNYLTLDKGRINGIKKDMAVISPSGIVGIVINVSRFFASVMPIINTDAKISVKIKHNNHMGSLVWTGTDYKIARLDDIPLHVEFEVGDTIVTSGYSAIFPEGIFVGTIKSSSYNGSESFFKIDIDLAVDFNNLNYVYVVENIMKNEQLFLEKQNN